MTQGFGHVEGRPTPDLARDFDAVESRLRGVRKGKEGEVYARCPVHDDRHASSSWAVGWDGQTVVGYCHVCSQTMTQQAWFTEALAVLAGRKGYGAKAKVYAAKPKSSSWDWATIREHPYFSPDGRVRFRKIKYRLTDTVTGEQSTTWLWKHDANFDRPGMLPCWLPGRGGQDPGLYLIHDVAPGQDVYLTEGEHDADALRSVGWKAVSVPDGADTWKPEWGERLRGTVLQIMADADNPGRRHARMVAQAMIGIAASVAVWEPPPPHKDAADWIAAQVRDPCVPLTAEEPEEPTGRRVRLTSAAEIKPRVTYWLWEARVPTGEITLTPGPGGIGKSTFHTWAIAHLTRGTLPGFYSGTPRPCLIAAREDDWERTIVPRLIAAGADLTGVSRVDVVDDDDVGSETVLTLPRDLASLEAEIIRAGVVLLSIDPLISSVDFELDTHGDRHVRQALEPLLSMAHRTRCVVLGNAHFNKGGGKDPLARIMGSAAFGNVPRAALGFARDPDAECVISQVKNNLGRLDLPSLRYRIESAIVPTEEGSTETGLLVILGESQRSVGDLLAEHGDDVERTLLAEAEEWLRRHLASTGNEAKPAEAKRAAIADGIAARTLERARMTVARLDYRGFPAQAYWVLLSASPTSSETINVGGTEVPVADLGERYEAEINNAQPRQGPRPGETGPSETSEQQPCQTCQTTERVTYYRNHDAWLCIAHNPFKSHREEET